MMFDDPSIAVFPCEPPPLPLPPPLPHQFKNMLLGKPNTVQKKLI